MSFTGQPIRRIEDPAILTGVTPFVDDIDRPGLLHAGVVRSTEARATIAGIDTSEAIALPGVVGVFTASDLGAANGPIPHPTWFPPNELLRNQIDVTARPEHLHLLAPGRVRYVGEPIALVVADDPYTVADAVPLVVVDYEPQPAVATIDDASQGSAGKRVNDEWPDNEAARFVTRKGDVATAFAGADVVVEGSFRMGRQTGTPLEPRGVLADPTGEPFTVWSSNQAPHWLRDAVSQVLALDHDDLRVVAPAVGGGFGTKSMVYPEELAIPLVARRLGRPVKWIETRTENFLASIQSRDQRHDIAVALRSDGTILGVRDRYVVDAGAANVEALIVPYNTTSHLQGCYRVPAMEIECVCLLTNKAPLSAYRGAGRPEAVFAMERILDRAARRLGLDPVDIRRVNMLRADEMPYDAGIPYRDGHRVVLDGGDYAGNLELALQHIDHVRIRAEQGGAGTAGRRIGVGVASYIEGTGIGPREEAAVRLEADGRMSVTVALPSQGQGHATTLAQVAADQFGIDIGRISVRQGDTHLMERGGGTIASRTAVVVGNAVAGAAAALRQMVLNAAGTALEADPADLRLEHDRIEVAGAPGRSITLRECASRAAAAGEELVGRDSFEPETVTFASGVHAAIVEVDEVTGAVHVLRYVVVHDCGRVINPLIVDAQVAGGVAQGIGAALLEELLYDDAGQLTTASFLDYQIPRAPDLPDIEVHHVETLSERNPLGLRGVGEAGAVGPPAAIAGAVEDALRDLDVVIDRCPMPPSYIVSLIDPSTA